MALPLYKIDKSKMLRDEKTGQMAFYEARNLHPLDAKTVKALEEKGVKVTTVKGEEASTTPPAT